MPQFLDKAVVGHDPVWLFSKAIEAKRNGGWAPSGTIDQFGRPVAYSAETYEQLGHYAHWVGQYKAALQAGRRPPPSPADLVERFYANLKSDESSSQIEKFAAVAAMDKAHGALINLTVVVPVKAGDTEGTAKFTFSVLAESGRLRQAAGQRAQLERDPAALLRA